VGFRKTKSPIVSVAVLARDKAKQLPGAIRVRDHVLVGINPLHFKVV
jgi:hypothetical protein